MAFVCTLSQDEPVMVTGLESEAGQGETMIRIPIGFDDATGAVYSVFVCLATVVGYGPLRHELVFHIVEAINGNENFCSDGSETLHIISDRIERRRVLQVICFATNLLIDEVAPVEVMMITHNAKLPRKALMKYAAICSVLTQRGYVCAHPDPFHGRHIWMFTQP